LDDVPGPETPRFHRDLSADDECVLVTSSFILAVGGDATFGRFEYPEA